MIRTTVFDGRAAAQAIKAEIRQKAIEENLHPNLAVILVGADPSSLSYVKQKKKACDELGFGFELYQLPANASFEEVKSRLSIINYQLSIDGIILQLPLPENLAVRQLTELILNSKDVDGLTPDSPFTPPTALAVTHVLESQQINISGARALVLGRGPTSGKPVAQLLRKLGADVIVAHSQTPLSIVNSQLSIADIIISCVGKPHLIKGGMIKEGAVVIGVGLSRVFRRSDLQREAETPDESREMKEGLTSQETSTIQGDLDEKSLIGKASLITPTPGGIGPLTVAFLLKNLLKASQKDS